MKRSHYYKDSNPPKHIIYGSHPVIEALEAGRSINKILIREGMTGERLKHIKSLAEALFVPVQKVPLVKLDNLSRQNNHQGIIAFVAAVEYQSLEETIIAAQATEKPVLFVMLDGVTDVRNFGAIARTALCMGASAVIVPGRGSAALNADAVKVSAGALNTLPICREGHLVDALMMLQAYGIESVACTEKAEELLYTKDLKKSLCLIMGSEEKGISTQLLRRADHLVKIPLQGPVSSLNVSVAAGMALSEVHRQRSTK